MTMKSLIIVATALVMPVGIAHAQTADPAADPAADAQQAATSQPAATSASTSAEPESAAVADTGAVQLAAKSDIKAGAAVVDQAGAPVGKIESVGAQGAVISTGKTKVQVPFASFGKSDKGLVIAMSKTELEAAAAKGS